MKEYIVYRCKSCNKHFILHKIDVTYNEKENKYITCPFNGKHKSIVVTGAYDSLKDAMSHSSYRREKGRIRQLK